MSHLALITTISRGGAIRHLYDAYIGYQVNDEDTTPAPSGSAFDTLTDRALTSMAKDYMRQGAGKDALDRYTGGSHSRRADWTEDMDAMAAGTPPDDHFPIQICEHIIIDQRTGRAVTPAKPRQADGSYDHDAIDRAHTAWTARWMRKAGFKRSDREHTRMLCMPEGGERKAEWKRAWQQAEYDQLIDNLKRYLRESAHEAAQAELPLAA